MSFYPGVWGKQGHSMWEQHMHRGGWDAAVNWGQEAGEGREVGWGLAMPEDLECQREAGAGLGVPGTAGLPSKRSVTEPAIEVTEPDRLMMPIPFACFQLLCPAILGNAYLLGLVPQ